MEPTSVSIGVQLLTEVVLEMNRLAEVPLRTLLPNVLAVVHAFSLFSIVLAETCRSF